ncbi:hypothetical protein HWV23_13120 [Natronomonas halophila]|uniref:hypothetical protein n=1 Tax=Natronomonas halophila TaxID=2747817 RepID=UPI0015B67A2A|nr:hypothetical protein [Natronomonas halophila]QLD86627.1 hypothetical protein HWV23_13120 [Natronomonas halophila]
MEFPRELQQFLDLFFRPKTAIISYRRQGLGTSLRNFAVVGLFVLVNVALIVQQIGGYEHGIRASVRSTYGVLTQFIVLITAFLPGYVLALVTLSKTAGLGRSVQSLLYAGGGFLILNISAQAAMPQKYTLVLNGIRNGGLRVLTGVRDPYAWEYTTGGITQGVAPLAPPTTDLASYSQAPLFETLATPVPAALFVVWIGSFGYFLYLLYLDVRINHGGSVAESLLALLITVWGHTIVLTSNNPLETFLRVGAATNVQAPIFRFLRLILGA